MKFLAVKQPNGLVPYDETDKEMQDKLQDGKVYEITVRLSRNYKFHKKFMKLCRIGCDNSKNVNMPFEAYREYVTIKAGYYELHQTPKGVFIRAKSIAFDSMDEAEFQELYNRVLDVIMQDIEADREVIEQQLISFL